MIKTTEEMLQEIKDFQNSKVEGVTLMHSDEETVDFCIKLVYEIYVEQKHNFEPNIDK